jgi:hypothetical protein
VWVRGRWSALPAVAAIVVAAVAALPVAEVGAQAPPGSRLVQIVHPGQDRLAAINSSREIVFLSYLDGSPVVMLYRSGEFRKLTYRNEEGFHPVITDTGLVAWTEGYYESNFDVIVLPPDGTQPYAVTDTPESEYGVDASQDGSLAWYVDLCPYPTGTCWQIELHDLGENRTKRLTYAPPWLSNNTVHLGERRAAIWGEDDRQFGLVNLWRVMYFDGERVQALTSRNRKSSPKYMDGRGRVYWNELPQGIVRWDQGVVEQILPWGGLRDVNDSGDIQFAGKVNGWLLRSGVFYQVFPGLTYSAPGLNNRGDVVCHGFGETPQDIFVTYIDPIPGDYDEDGDADLDDLIGLDDCLRGPGAPFGDPRCAPLDLDADGDVDLVDAAGFLERYTGDCALGITTPPNGFDACVGQPITFSVDLRGRPASYQWRFGTQDIPGATDSTYTINSLRTADAGFYGVRITSECGWEITSEQRYHLVVPSAPPAFRIQPEDQTVCPGQDVMFSTYPREEDYPTYQWEKDGQPIAEDADYRFLVLRDVAPEDAGTYRLKLTNSCGSSYSRGAVLRVDPPAGPPTIRFNPISQRADLGAEKRVFHVLAWCGEEYQWRKDGEDLPGATEPSLTIEPVTCADAGEYTVKVCNQNGFVTSTRATLTVTGCE